METSDRKTTVPQVGDICVLMLTRIVVRVVEIKQGRAYCETLYRNRNEYPDTYQEINHFNLDDLLTISDLMQSWSDFMTFAAFVKNYSPQDEPLNKGLVWRFWNIGHTAYMHLLKWDVKEQL